MATNGMAGGGPWTDPANSRHTVCPKACKKLNISIRHPRTASIFLHPQHEGGGQGQLKAEAEQSAASGSRGQVAQDKGQAASHYLPSLMECSPTGVQLGRPCHQHLLPAVSWSRSCSMESLLLSTQARQRTIHAAFWGLQG